MSTVPQQRRSVFVVLAIVALSLGLAYALWPPSPSGRAAADQPQQEPASVAQQPVEQCLRLAARPPAYSDMTPESYWRAADAWAASCRQAIASDDDSRLKVALARALRPDQRAEEVALLRAAAAQDNAEANFLIWDSHRSWDQHLDRPRLIERDESSRALRKAAELGYPQAMFRLAALLDSGGVVKRNPAEARYWAERALEHPSNYIGRDSLAKFAGRLLAASDKPDERARGIAILESLSKAGAFGARSALAAAIRRDDPVRARSLLEEAKRSDPGGALPELADMLNKGEGGAADPQRAWKLLQGHNDIPSIEGMRGQFYLEGKQVPRDVAKAIELIRHAGVWDYAPQLQVVQLLAANPEVKIDRPEQVLYHAVEAAELDEPGAMAALIELKLSPHPQFRDRPGGCKLLQAAAARGDQVAPERLTECRAN
jgi:TPR repeat protein